MGKIVQIQLGEYRSVYFYDLNDVGCNRDDSVILEVDGYCNYPVWACRCGVLYISIESIIETDIFNIARKACRIKSRISRCTGYNFKTIRKRCNQIPCLLRNNIINTQNGIE